MRFADEQSGRRSGRSKLASAVRGALTKFESLERRQLLSAFTPGDVVVYRVGSGTGSLSSAATAVYLDEYTPSGTLVQSIAMPTSTGSGTTPNPLTASGTATSEGNLTLSTNGRELMVPGYDAAAGVASIASTNASTTGIITKATNATPIVITTGSTIGMTNGDQVTISGVGGNTSANGTFFIKVLNSSTFSLFSDSGLTNGVAGNGTYTSGGTWTDATLTTIVPREVGVVSASGAVDTTTTLGGALSANNIRGAASVDGTGIWAAGANGTVYTTFGSSTDATSLTSQNTRTVEINGGQLYITTGSFSPVMYIDTVGTGLPTTSGQSIAEIPGLVDASAGSGVGGPYQIAFASLGGGSSPDTIYIADNFNFAVEKYSLVGGTWTPTGYVGGTSTNPLHAITGVVAQPAPGGEEIIVTTPTNVYSLLDTSGPGGMLPTTTTLTTVATAGANTAFRGIAFAPQSTLTVTSQPTSVTAALGTNATLFASVNGGTDASVQWQANSGSGWSNISNGANYSGTTTDMVTILDASLAQSGTQYRAVFNGPAAGSVTSNPATLTVVLVPVITSINPNAGPVGGGTSVTITGTNLANATAVDFGSVAGTITGDTDTSITVTSPAEASGTVDVKVIASGATSASSASDKFTFGAPAVSGVSPSTGDDSGGTTVTITGSGFTNASAVSFGGVAVPTTQITVLSDTQISVVSPADFGAGAVDVVVSDAAGSSATSSSDKFTYTPTTLAQAEQLASGSTAILDNHPVVTAILGTNAFLINDGTGSVDVFGGSAGYTPTLGDELSVSGTWAPFNQIPEITPKAITVIATGVTPPSPADPLTETIPQVNLATLPFSVAGHLITLHNVTISGISGTFGTQNLSGTITDGSNNSMTLFYWPTSYSAAADFFNGLAIPTTAVNLTGIVDVFNGNQPEFIPLSEPGTPDRFSIASNATPTGEADGFSAVNRGTAITVTINRTESTDAASVTYMITPDSATLGTDYTVPVGTLGTISFAAGQSSQSFVIDTSANPGDAGDKLFSISITNPTGGSGFLPQVVGGPSTIVITDPSTPHTLSNSSFLENATVQVTGPRHTANQTGTSDSGISLFQMESNNSTNGNFASYGVLTYNDSVSDPSHVFDVGANHVAFIDGIELETVAVPESFNKNGLLNVYVTFDTTTDITWNATNPLKFDTAGDPVEGVGSALAPKYLLGQINYSANQVPGGYTPFNLTNLDPTGDSMLAGALQSGSPFRIVVTPADSTVAASWEGSNSAISLQSPILRINYSTTLPTLPSWLSNGSQATWDAASHALTVSGNATIIADPGTDEPVVTVGNGGHLIVQPTNGDEFIHLGGLNLTNGGTADVKAVSSRSHDHHDVLVIGTVTGAAPVFAIDALDGSKLDLESNDLIIHGGSLSSVQSLAATGRNVAPGGIADGTWNGNGLTSSLAASQDASDGIEMVQLAVVRNGDLPLGQFSDWTVGSQQEALRSDGNDIIVKYDYTGDFALQGFVGGDSATVFGAFFDNGASSGNSWAFGDTNGDGKIDGDDATIFGAFFGDGSNGNGPML